MKTMFLSALGLLAALGMAAPAAAQADGDYYTFDLVNQSDYTILTFKTRKPPSGTYSNDWMPTRVLAPDDDIAMRFFDSEDACLYDVEITFNDGDTWEERLDFCDLEYVVVTNEGISGTNGD
ncbi:hypothetical protein HZ989_02350 [Brevundimonas sp. AJA228-03]|uniref:hypothetical protein n=1 Tax=Brevundimonas sp. AJA228-03 TaxID=2752515 RepID=UPI001AE0778D|nr:hypothetical protein [Brevundimonas sp. AJA228-03]QTN19941.1 hypothetical protein HZ989_02350 [Brevundimonas sp. AJA228-03]